MRVSGARSNHTAAPRQNRSEADFSAAVMQQTRSRSATQTVCPKGQGFGWKWQALGMQRNFKCERAWSDFTGAGWNCRWAGSGIERRGLLRLWAVEPGERTPTWAGSGNSHRSAPLTCSVVRSWACWSEIEVCSGASLAHCYFEATEIDCAIDQLKPGLKSKAQYLFFCYLKSVSNMRL